MPAYYDHPLYIEALAQSVERAYAGLDRRPDVLVTSYHGVPERYLAEGDPYHCHCREDDAAACASGSAGARRRWSSRFQSRFGPEEWLKPYTVEEVARLAKAGKQANRGHGAGVFGSDCIETLEEINDEIRESFVHAGGESFHLHPLPQRRRAARRGACEGHRG